MNEECPTLLTLDNFTDPASSYGAGSSVFGDGHVVVSLLHQSVVDQVDQ